MNPQDKLTQGHYLELMDRLHVIMCTIEDHCVQHPLAKANKDIQFRIDYALGQLWDAYQEVGKLEYEKYKS